jgi:hypothetical protein
MARLAIAKMRPGQPRMPVVRPGVLPATMRMGRARGTAAKAATMNLPASKSQVRLSRGIVIGFLMAPISRGLRCPLRRKARIRSGSLDRAPSCAGAHGKQRQKEQKT